LNRNAEYWKNLKVEEEARILKSFVFSESKYFVAAFDGSKIVGALGVVAKEFPFTRHVGGIGMSVQRTYSGQGLATELMKLAIQEAPRAGLSRLELTVRTYNSPAIRVYERLGFRRVGVLKQAAKVGDLFVDEYLYELLL
jgi:RimJ/RimL family protein N-acetyltransferase